MNWSIFDQSCFNDEVDDNETIIFDDSVIVSIILSFCDLLNTELSQINTVFCRCYISMVHSTRIIKKISVKKRENYFYDMVGVFSNLLYRFVEVSRKKVTFDIITSPPSQIRFCECLLPLFLQDRLKLGRTGLMNGRFLIKSTKKVIVLFNEGGNFAGFVAEGNKIVEQLAFSSYVVREEQGKRQVKFDKTTKGMKSRKNVGAQMRRRNEQLFAQQVKEIMFEWKSLIETAGIILIHAPGHYNKSLLFNVDVNVSQHIHSKGKIKKKNKNLKHKRKVIMKYNDPRIITIPFQVHSVNLTEARKMYDRIFRYSVSMK